MKLLLNVKRDDWRHVDGKTQQIYIYIYIYAGNVWRTFHCASGSDVMTWRETLSAPFALCGGNPHFMDSPQEGSVIRSSNISFVVTRNKILNKQPRCWWPRRHDVHVISHSNPHVSQITKNIWESSERPTVQTLYPQFPTPTSANIP